MCSLIQMLKEHMLLLAEIVQQNRGVARYIVVCSNNSTGKTTFLFNIPIHIVRLFLLSIVMEFLRINLQINDQRCVFFLRGRFC